MQMNRHILIQKITILLLCGLSFALARKNISPIEKTQGKPTKFVSKSKLGQYSEFAISSDAPSCAAVGKRIFLMNGTAVDVAIATLLCNGLVHIHSMGVGGGFLMVYYKAAEKKTYVLDSRETAPAAASEKMFVNLPNLSKTVGPLSIGIPSEIKGLYAAWQRFGKLPWNILFEDAIRMADKGVLVSKTLAKMIKEKGPVQPEYSGLWEILYNKNAHRFLKQGEYIVRPKLADYLKRVASRPADILTGELDVDVAADLREAGAIITLKDLINYIPEWREPITMPIYGGSSKVGEKNGFELHTAPPPCSGVLVGLALNMMAKYNNSSLPSQSNVTSSLYHHRLLETFKAIFAKRTYLSDENFMSPDAAELLEQMTMLSFAEELQKRINDAKTAPVESYGSVFSIANDQGTSHISIVGPNGDGLAVTSTINTWFGSAVVGNRTGILFNNEMDDFSSPFSRDTYNLPATPANLIHPGKRPMSSMSPVIITHRDNGTVRLVIGGSGGSQIITSVVTCALENLQRNMNIKEAIDASRLHHQLNPNSFRYDRSLPKNILEDLIRRGHKADTKPPAASVQGVEVFPYSCLQGAKMGTGRCLGANADYRKGGETAGF